MTVLGEIDWPTTYSGNVFNPGMWQNKWKTFGHLSQQRTASPPSIQTAHQSSFGSSFDIDVGVLLAVPKKFVVFVN